MPEKKGWVGINILELISDSEDVQPPEGTKTGFIDHVRPHLRTSMGPLLSRLNYYERDTRGRSGRATYVCYNGEA